MVATPTGQRRAVRVLCVDDNRDVADSEAVLLSVVGYDARACYDGRAALDQATGFRPDACLIDLTMPGMDGDEVAVRLRGLLAGADVTLVAVTGAADAAGRERIAAAGFHRHLVKPARLNDLLAAIHGPPGEPARAGGPPV